MTVGTVESNMKRRTMLAGTGFVLSVTLAGCGLNNDSVESTPVDAVETYLGALDNDDPETANKHAHEDGEYFIPEDSPDNAQLRAMQHADSLTIVELTEIDRETAVREMLYRVLSGSPEPNPTDPDEIDDERVNRAITEERVFVEDVLSETYDVEEYAYVLYKIQLDGEKTDRMPIFLFQTEAQWLIWGPRPEIVWF